MKRRAFTLIELLVAMAIMMFLVQFLVMTFAKTGEVASAHVKSMEIYSQAQNVLDRIHEDIRRINLMKINPDIALVGRNASNNTSTPLASGTTSSPYSVAFVTSNFDIRQDQDISQGDGKGPANTPFDGWVVQQSTTFSASKGLQEVAYYLTREDKDIPTWNLHRAVLSPIGTADSLLDVPLSDFSTDAKFRNHYRISENIIYSKLNYTYLKQTTNANSWIDTTKQTYDTRTNTDQFFPGAINITVSFAAGMGTAQNEGELIDSCTNTSTELVIKKTSGIFPIARNSGDPDNDPIQRDCLGYILVGKGLGAGVFEFHNIKLENTTSGPKYTFFGEFRILSNQVEAGTDIIVGYTFSRSYHIR